MSYTDITERGLAWVLADAAIHPHSADYADMESEVRFVFKSSDGDDDEDGPTVVCHVVTPATDIPASQLHPLAVTKALKMVRHLAQMTDEQVLQAWQSSLQRALAE